MANRKLSQRAGFTLVELLVVIGIIALLISILLPVLNKAKERANTIKCLSQQKQILMAVIMYAGENGGLLPIPPSIGDTFKTYPAGDRRNSLMYYMSDDNGGAGVLRYDAGVWWPYLVKGVNKGAPNAATQLAASKSSLNKVMNCPSDAFEAYRHMFWGSSSVVPRNFTYSWNIQMWGSNGNMPGNRLGIGNDQVVKKHSQVKQAAHKILLIEELAPNDGQSWIQCDDKDDVPAEVHLGKGNYGFADGHAEGVSQRDLGFSTGKGFGSVNIIDLNRCRYYFSLREDR